MSIRLFLYRLRAASRMGELRRFKLCEFDIAALILLSGDVEINPGPVPKRDNHRKWLMKMTLLVLLMIIQETEQITLQQTVPPNNELVCPGEKLVYTCTSETGTLRWETPTGVTIFFSTDNINNTDTVPEFDLLLVDISGDALVSTATANMVKSSDANIRVKCSDGITLLARDLLISEKPGNCQGIVSCSAIASQDSSKSPTITVSLAVSDSINCASFYEFMLGDDVMTTNETSVTFRNYSYGTPYENQEIYVLNNDGTRGTVPCYYSIPAPNAMQEVFMTQNCMGNTIQLFFIYNPPTLPLGSCLNPAQLLWGYTINLTGNVTGDFMTMKNTFEVNVTQLGAFTIAITPTLPILGLSGSPLITTLVVTAQCELELPGTCPNCTCETEPSSNIVASLAFFVFLSVILLLLTILLVIGFLKLKLHRQKEDGNSSEEGGTPKQEYHHVKRTESVSSPISLTGSTMPLVPPKMKIQGEGTEIDSSPGAVEAMSLLVETEDVVEELLSSQEDVSKKEEEKSREAQKREEMKETRKKESEDEEGVIMEAEGTRTEVREWEEDKKEISQLRDRVREQQAELERTIIKVRERNEETTRQREELRDAHEKLKWREQEGERMKVDAQGIITKLLTKLADLEERYQLIKFAAKRAVLEGDSELEIGMPFPGEQYDTSLGAGIVSYAKPVSDSNPHPFDSDELVILHSSTKFKVFCSWK